MFLVVRAQRTLPGASDIFSYFYLYLDHYTYLCSMKLVPIKSHGHHPGFDLNHLELMDFVFRKP